MSYCIDVSYKPYINSENDITVKVTKGKNNNCNEYINPNIIDLDAKGKRYMVTFCMVEYGGCGPEDYVSTYSVLFKANAGQAKVLQTLEGHLGTGISMDEVNTYIDSKEAPKKSQAYLKLEEVLNQLGDAKTLLKTMNIHNAKLYEDVFVFINKVPK